MRILGQFVLLVIVGVGSVLEELHRWVLQLLLGAFIMDCASCFKFLTQGYDFFGCGFFVFGRFSHVFNVLGLFLMFGFGLRLLRLGFSHQGRSKMQFLCDVRGKSKDLRGGIRSKHEVDEVYDPKMESCPSGSLKLADNCKGLVKVEEDGDEKVKDFGPEDEEFDVMALRELVKVERRRTKSACHELEKERKAAGSAANEAMSMILRLQSEKSSLEIDTNQYKRMAEQKEEYNQQLIESLQWMVMKHESERSLLENQLQLCKQMLKIYMKDDEIDQFLADAGFNSGHATLGDGMENESVSSLGTQTLVF